jgi:NhaB family Na+:H+ antiporter
MVWMALPYTITMTLMGLLAAYVVLEPATNFLYDINLIQPHSITGQETGGPAHH